jgi:hypothetical protein
MTLKFDPEPGSHISEACTKAVALANAKKQSVEFEFNGTAVIANPGDSPEALDAKWNTDFEAAGKSWRESPECIERERKREEEYRQKCAAVLVEKAQTEKEMREAADPWPCTEKQLLEYVKSLVDRDQDYGTCVYAMSLAALAAFHFAAHKLGVTGFQASCADLDFIRRTRSLKGPFMLIKAEDALYPQRDPVEKLHEAMREWIPWIQEQASIKLRENGGAHPAVVAHWKRLTELGMPKE